MPIIYGTPQPTNPVKLQTTEDESQQADTNEAQED